ncbi:response regulator [Flavobacterium sp. K5-23]|uniref:response regulator n=1 Tax=Flavobacterium sp. K5-23 TaxID=2746225 RepID=UPI00200D0B53|nr:response regulator [Flavobacterium sp. K5-23]UQD55259.1 response regulator [Flavobacterium sp. K5-23]
MGNPNFILIDDDKIMLFLIEFEIKKHFNSSSIASYVKSDVALNFINENCGRLENTVILLDLNMPVMDGFQLLERLNSFSHNLKVVIVTSSISDGDREKAMVYPFVQGYMNKPIKGLDLKTILSKA